jgi:hypothetical protein
MKKTHQILFLIGLFSLLLGAACNPQPAAPSTAVTQPPAPILSPAEMKTAILGAFGGQSALAYQQVSDVVLQDGAAHHTVVKFMPPSSYSIVSDEKTELSVIGDKVYLKDNGAWGLIQASAGDIIDMGYLERLEKTISDIQYLGTDTLNGKSVRIYQFKNGARAGGTDVTVQTKAWLGAADSLPYQMVITGPTTTLDTATGKVSSVPSVTTTVYTYDASITVSAPGVK